MNVSWARSSASAWLPEVSRRSVARTADWCRRTSSENACRSSWTTTRAMSWASVTGGGAIGIRSRRGSGSSAGCRTAGRGSTLAATRPADVSLLEPPQHDVADSDEEEHEPQGVGFAVLEKVMQRQPEADATHYHALAQIRPRGPTAQLLRPFVDRAGRRTGGDHRAGRIAGQR